jgi:hypothetical protein
MERIARRVKAERDRRRLPHRPPAARWALRLTGVVATATLLGIGVASALMILPDSDGGGGGLVLAPAATPEPTPTPKPKPTKPRGPTRAQRAQRSAAVAELRRQGFTTLKPSDYDYNATLRVLIGRPVGDAAGGSYAFFFLKDRFLARDSTSPSSKVRVAKRGKATVTLAYDTSAGRVKVRFRLDGQTQTLLPLDPIPPAAARFFRGAA